MNETKTKAIANGEEMEEAIEEEFRDKGLKCSETFVLVGAILCNRLEDSEDARDFN